MRTTDQARIVHYRPNTYRRARGLVAAGAAMMATLALTTPALVSAAEGTYGEDNSIGINVASNGPFSGLDIRLNNNGGGYTLGSDLFWVNGAVRWGIDGMGPMVSIGGVLHGQAGPAHDAAIAGWDSIEVVSRSGSATLMPEAAAGGDGQAVLLYTATENGLVYTMERTATYVAPGRSFTDSYRFDIPEGNTAEVRFYYGGNLDIDYHDATADNVLWHTDSPRLIGLVGDSGDWFGVREISGGKPFDGAMAGEFSAPYEDIRAGLPLGFGTSEGDDNGLYLQWDLGTDPGSQQAAIEVGGDMGGVPLRARIDATDVAVGEAFPLTFFLSADHLPADGLGFGFTLPQGLQVTGAAENSCGGTVSTQPATAITVTEVELPAFGECSLTIPVAATAAGTFDFSPTNLASADGVTQALPFHTVTATAVAPQISDQEIPALTVGTPVDLQLEATGTAPLTYSVGDGALPAGVTLSAAGRLTGAPTTAGSSEFTLQVENEAGSDTASFTIDVARGVPAPPQLTVRPPEIPAGESATLSATGLPEAATGSVHFLSDGSELCAAVLPESTCSTPDDLAVGTHQVTAHYSGDDNWSAADSEPVSLTVAKVATELILEGSYATVEGTPATIEVGGIPAAATGTIAIVVGEAAPGANGPTGPVGLRAPAHAFEIPALRDAPSNGTTLCSFDVAEATGCTVPADIDPGSYPISAVYQGDARHSAASARSELVVNAVPTTPSETSVSTEVPTTTEVPTSTEVPNSTEVSTTTEVPMSPVVQTSTMTTTSSASTPPVTTERTPKASGDGLAAPGPAGGDLAATGADVGPQLWSAALLLVLGIGLVLVGNSDRRSARRSNT